MNFTPQLDDLPFEPLDASRKSRRRLPAIRCVQFASTFRRRAWRLLPQQTRKRNTGRGAEERPQPDREVIRQGRQRAHQRAKQGQYHAHRIPLFFIVLFCSEICLVTHGSIRESCVNNTAKSGAQNTMQSPRSRQRAGACNARRSLRRRTGRRTRSAANHVKIRHRAIEPQSLTFHPGKLQWTSTNRSRPSPLRNSRRPAQARPRRLPSACCCVIYARLSWRSCCRRRSKTIRRSCCKRHGPIRCCRLSNRPAVFSKVPHKRTCQARKRPSRRLTSERLSAAGQPSAATPKQKKLPPVPVSRTGASPVRPIRTRSRSRAAQAAGRRQPDRRARRMACMRTSRGRRRMPLAVFPQARRHRHGLPIWT